MSKDYTVEDKGLLIRPMKRLLWDPLLKWVPLSVSANALTLSGTAANLIGITLLLVFPTSRAFLALAGILAFAYLTLDNIDGAQARRTGTGSPLGEFYDHWLDGIHGSYLSLGAIVAWEGVGVPGFLAILLAGVAYTMTCWEQRTTGHMNLAILGSVEGITLVSVLLITQAILGPHWVAATRVAFGYNVADVIIGVTIITGALTALSAVWRVKRKLAELPGLLVAPAALTAWYVLHRPPLVPIALVHICCTQATGGRMVASRVTKRPGLGADYAVVIPTVLVALGCIALRPSPSTENTALLALAGYAFAKVALDFADNVRRLAHHRRPSQELVSMGARNDPS